MDYSKIALFTIVLIVLGGGLYWKFSDSNALPSNLSSVFPPQPSSPELEQDAPSAGIQVSKPLKINQVALEANVTEFPYQAILPLQENSKYAVNFNAGGGWFFMEIRGAKGEGTWKATTNRPEDCCRNDTASYSFDINLGEGGEYGIKITVPDQPPNQTKASWVYYNVIRQSTIDGK